MAGIKSIPALAYFKAAEWSGRAGAALISGLSRRRHSQESAPPRRSDSQQPDSGNQSLHVIVHSARALDAIKASCRAIARAAEHAGLSFTGAIVCEGELAGSIGNDHVQDSIWSVICGQESATELLSSAIQEVEHAWCWLVHAGIEPHPESLKWLWSMRSENTLCLNSQRPVNGNEPAPLAVQKLPWGWWARPESLPRRLNKVLMPLETLVPDLNAGLIRTEALNATRQALPLYDMPVNMALSMGVWGAGRGLQSLHVPQAQANTGGLVRDFDSPPGSPEHQAALNDAEWLAYCLNLPDSVPPTAHWVGHRLPWLRTRVLLRERLQQRGSKHVLPPPSEVWRILYPRAPANRSSLPWLVWVCPFRTVPASHGGARRIIELTRVLAKRFRIAVIADEGWEYEAKHLAVLAHVDRLHLLMHKHSRPTEQRSIERIKEHSYAVIATELKRIIRLLRPLVVELQHEELLGLSQGPVADERWISCLHDVNQTGQDDETDRWVAERCQALDSVIVCSEEDRDLISHRNLVQIDNGVSISEFASDTRSSGFSLLFVGPFRYQPNIDGLIEFLEHCYPDLKAEFPELELLVVNGDATDKRFHRPELLRLHGVRLLGLVLDMPRLLSKATLVINPLKGVRGSCLKTIEALAAGRVCITTEDAARGFKSLRHPALITVENIPAMTKAISQMLVNENQRHAAEMASPKALHQFDWQTLGNRLADHYLELATRPQDPGA